VVLPVPLVPVMRMQEARRYPPESMASRPGKPVEALGEGLMGEFGLGEGKRTMPWLADDVREYFVGAEARSRDI